MPQLIYALALLACPVAMGAMMWMMMRGGGSSAPAQGDGSAELARMKAEIDQLRAAQRRGNITAR